MALPLNCRICGEKHAGKMFIAKEMMFGLKDEFEYFQCSQCECLQIVQIPVDLSNYYPNDYYSFLIYDGKRFKGLKGKVYRARVKSTVFNDRLVRKLINLFMPVRKLNIFRNLMTKGTRILDVGCGNGEVLLYPLKEAGLQYVVGCDPYIPNDINYKNGLGIRKKDIFGLHDRWDIIVYNHSFEHISNPLENLIKVQELLVPGGICILRIPTVPNYAWSHYGTNWAQLDAPRHLFLHSPKSISYLAKKAGLTLEKIIYDSTFFQFSGSDSILNGIPLLKSKSHGHNSFFVRKFKKIKYKWLAKGLNRKGLGDQAAFYLKKNSI